MGKCVLCGTPTVKTAWDMNTGIKMNWWTENVSTAGRNSDGEKKCIAYQ